MIDFIKTLFDNGDIIYLSYNNGITISGKILNFGESFIVVEDERGNIIGVKEDAINSFSKEPISYSQPNMTIGSQDMRCRGKSDFGQGFDNNSRKGYSWGSQKPKKTTFKQYKAGDKIPIDSLTKRDPALAESWRRSENDRRRLHQIKEDIKALYEEVKATSTDLELEVPAIGVIVEIKPSFQFGFIDDVENGERYFYNRGDIVDKELKNMVGEGIKVVYFRSSNHKGPAAKCIHRPDSIGHLLDIMIELVDEDDFIRAKIILQNILSAYPDSQSAQKLLNGINESLSAEGMDETVGHTNSLYVQARKAFETKKYSLAIKLYQECIEKEVRKTNSIKELAQVYISLHSQAKDEDTKEAYRQKGLEFIETHKEELPDNSSTKFSLENIYFALGDYSKHIDVVEDIITECGESGELAQYVFYLNKAAQSYLRLKDFDRAMDAADQGLEVDPNNSHLRKTKESIEQAQSNHDEEGHTKPENEGKGGFFGFLSR